MVSEREDMPGRWKCGNLLFAPKSSVDYCGDYCVIVVREVRRLEHLRTAIYNPKSYFPHFFFLRDFDSRRKEERMQLISRSLPAALTISAIVICLVTPFAQGFVFRAVPGTRKCFGEDLLEDIRYEVRTKMSRSLAAFTIVTMTGPDNQPIFESQGTDEEVTHLIEARVVGVHTACFTFKSSAQHAASSSSSAMDVSIDIEDFRDVEARKAREETHDEKIMAPNPAMIQAHYVEQAVTHIHRDYTYLKEREAQMRDTNESTNTRTWAVSVVTVIAVLAVSFVRHYKLQRFLVMKKMLD